VATLLALPRSLYASLFRGLQRMAFTNVIDVGTSALQQLGIILILAYRGSLFAVVDWIALSYLLGIAAYVLVASRFVPWRTLVPGFSATVVRRNRRFALHMMSISALATIHTQADKVVVSKLMPLGVLGYYSFASAVVTRATMVSTAVAQAGFPSFSHLFHRGQRPELMSQYGKLQTLLTFSMVPLYAAITFAALPFFGYLFTPAIGQRLLAPTALLCAGFYLNSTLAVPYIFSLAVGKPEISVRQNVYALFTVLPATVVLVALFGLVGAAASWVVYNLFAYGYGLPRICRECLMISPSSWYAQIARAVALGAATYGTAWLLLAYFERLTLPYLVAGYLAGSAAFLLGSWSVIGPELRHTLIGLAPFHRIGAAPNAQPTQ
jgi:O-antigen/teichoic acid export membrane protein